MQQDLIRKWVMTRHPVPSDDDQTWPKQVIPYYHAKLIEISPVAFSLQVFSLRVFHHVSVNPIPLARPGLPSLYPRQYTWIYSILVSRGIDTFHQAPRKPDPMFYKEGKNASPTLDDLLRPIVPLYDLIRRLIA
ncbi:hypothetical protein SUGI_0260060 [Cryptomeria japonica]|nr:hypothetical protein SUGI_0260060 [Cryptomeria japonica]